jgi:dihydrofolate reductase
MSKIRVAGVSLSIDGFGAGPEQSLENPLGIEASLGKARAAAGGKDIKIGGGVSTVRHYLQAGLVDEIHFAIAPVLLGQGESMFRGIDMHALGFKVVEQAATEHATHIVLSR